MTQEDLVALRAAHADRSRQLWQLLAVGQAETQVRHIYQQILAEQLGDLLDDLAAATTLLQQVHLGDDLTAILDAEESQCSLQEQAAAVWRHAVAEHKAAMLARRAHDAAVAQLRRDILGIQLMTGRRIGGGEAGNGTP